MRVAVAQTGSVLFDTPATLARVDALCRAAAAHHAQLIVFPEALLGGYPRGLTFGATLGNRSDAGRELFHRYADSAVTCPGPEIDTLCVLARELDLHIVIGIVERVATTLFCSTLTLSPSAGLIARHRKLVPTGTERLLWAQASLHDDPSILDVVPTPIGRIGTAICWENYLPLYRQHLYNQRVELWCAPTVDARPMWQHTIRHIAYEGRCFVLSACQHLTLEDWPNDLPQAFLAERGTISGASIIVSPFGEILAGPASGQALLYADLDRNDIQRGRFDLDVAGHSSRPDIFAFSIRPPHTP